VAKRRPLHRNPRVHGGRTKLGVAAHPVIAEVIRRIARAEHCTVSHLLTKMTNRHIARRNEPEDEDA
jgi:hypothetical protein